MPLICSLAPPPPVYKRNYLARGDEFNRENDTIGFDVVTEQVFPGRPAFLAWLAKLSEPGTGERVVADEEQFLDGSRYWAYVIEEHGTTE